jgi:hypothetical protein
VHDPEKLRQAASAFFEARSSNEVDLSGTARAQFEAEEEEELEKSFAKFLTKLERGGVSAATDADLAKADHELNAVYRQVMKTKPQDDWGTVTTENIRNAERPWPAYRDAWADFARVKFPKSDPNGIKVWLTRDRTGILEGFLPTTH